MIRPLPLLPLVIALSVASCQKEREQETTVPPLKQQPARALGAEVSIASISLLEDCPDADSKAAAGDSRIRQDSDADESEDAEIGGYLAVEELRRVPAA